MKIDAIKIEKKIKELGYDVRVQFAQTGTTYFHCVHHDTGIRVKVRIADHAELYPPLKGERCIDVSESGTTIKGAFLMLMNPEAIDIGTAIVRGEMIFADESDYQNYLDKKKKEVAPKWHNEIRQARQAWIDAGRPDWTAKDFEDAGFREKIAEAMISRRYGDFKIRFKSKSAGRFALLINS